LLNLTIASVAETLYFAVARDTRIVSADYVSKIGATKENTIFEGYTPLNPTYPDTIFDGFIELDVSKPINPQLMYIILSSRMYSRFYFEPDKYGEYIAFYDNLKSNKAIMKEFKPVEKKESLIDIINIVNNIQTITGFLRGGYSGPTIIVYKY